MTERQREAVARAIWNVMSEYEDRCDMELEDIGDKHHVWEMADAAMRALPAAAAPSGWRTIESANKAPTLLLGYWNENGKWRTTRGCWFTKEQIEDTWEDDEMPEGWYETPVEGDACYLIHPTHWQPLPAAPDA